MPNDKIGLRNSRLITLEEKEKRLLKHKIDNYMVQMKDLPNGFVIIDTEYFQYPDKGIIKKIIVEVSFMVVYDYMLIDAHTAWFKLNDEHYTYWKKHNPKQYEKLHFFVDTCGTSLFNYWNHYQDYFTKGLLIAHGHNTEESEFNSFFIRHKMINPEILWIDSLQIYDNLPKRVKRHPANLRLKTLTEEFGLEHIPHFASSDTKAILDLMCIWHEELNKSNERKYPRSKHYRNY